MIEIDKNGYFITGSDTDVGKTYIGCELLRQLRQHACQLEVRKPAESGCKPDAHGELIATDAQQLNAANLQAEDMNRVAPNRFRAALAPHRAARLEGKVVKMANLIEVCSRDNIDHLLIVEGAGGFYSPLAEDGLNADLASVLQLPVIIVVSDRVGAVNQALLTIQAVESRHLTIAAIILNRVQADHELNMDNIADLRQHCGYEVFHCGYQQSLPDMFLVPDNKDSL